MSDERRTFYIYCHVSPSGKRYIGQTCVSLEQRWANGRGYHGCRYFDNAIKKYGWDNIRHYVICVCHYKSVADEFEKHYIAKYDTTNKQRGYNICTGGGGSTGHVLSEEAKRKIGIANTGNTWDEERKRKHSKAVRGKNNGMYGRHHTPESLKKMSENRAKVPFTEEMRRQKTAILLEANKKRRVPVRQLDLDGNLIATFQGINEVEQKLGFDHSNVVPACQGKQRTAYGYRWEYEDEELRAEAERLRKKRPSYGHPVIQYDLDGNEVGRFESITDAARKTGVPRYGIGDACHGELGPYRGFIWRFEGSAKEIDVGDPVVQYDMDGNEIARYQSMDEASKRTGIKRVRIKHCCMGVQASANGFKWQFAKQAA